VTPAGIARECAIFLLYQAGPGALYVSEAPDLPPGMFEKLANETSEALDAVIEGRPWLPLRIDLPVERTIQCYGALQDPRGCRIEYRTLTPNLKCSFPAIFTMAVMDLVSDESWRPARCARPDCNRRFSRSDPRQEYCNPRCSQTTRTQRMRANAKTNQRKR
jgi:hypothetical protein